jgi:nucleolar MIF4G domain-containing protein 1
MMQPAIAKIGYPNLNTRTKFMIETLTNLKNNRLKSATANSVVVSEATIRMKRLLGALNTRHIRASEPLRVSLADIRNTDSKGKWWLVGASWAGNQASDVTAPDAKKSTKSPDKGEENLDFYSPTDLLQLARQQRMNTDVRQAIFVAIMSAEDYTDAHNRILKLRLKRKQEPEIPRVLIHCCGSEASYNPYYTLVARNLCARNSLRTAFAFSLWAVFRQMGEGASGREETDLFEEDEGEEGLNMRKILHLSRMYGTLIAEGALGLDVLKILDIAYLQTKTKTFLELMFITVILETLGQDSANEDALARVFLKVRENGALVRGTLYFLRKHVKGTDVMESKAEAAIVARGIRKSCSLLETFIARDTLGE